MTHQYFHPIAVTVAHGRPTSIQWRGITYRVTHVNEPWHLIDREWEQPEAPGSETGPCDRTYYRVRCVSAHEDLICEIYFEAIGGVWILERVYD